MYIVCAKRLKNFYAQKEARTPNRDATFAGQRQPTTERHTTHRGVPCGVVSVRHLQPVLKAQAQRLGLQSHALYRPGYRTDYCDAHAHFDKRDFVRTPSLLKRGVMLDFGPIRSTGISRGCSGRSMRMAGSSNSELPTFTKPNITATRCYRETPLRDMS